MYKKRLCVLVLIFLSEFSYAIPPSQCITLNDLNNGGVALKNTCNAKLNVTFCVENTNSSFNCKRNGKGYFSGGGSYLISPGNQQPIPFYRNDGGGTVRWAACLDTESINNWGLSGYACN